MFGHEVYGCLHTAVPPPKAYQRIGHAFLFEKSEFILAYRIAQADTGIFVKGIISTKALAVQQLVNEPAAFAAEMAFTGDDLIVWAGIAAVAAKKGGIGFLHSAS